MSCQSSSLTASDFDALRPLLADLQNEIRTDVGRARETSRPGELAEVAHITAADTIYKIDRVSEATIVSWFDRHWPKRWPVQLVMEGIEDEEAVTFPKGTPIENTLLKAILDPIDGTRNLMYDKRSAWSLGALALQRGAETNLADIVVACMTELPTTKAWRSDQISAIRGRGKAGVVAQAHNLLNGTEKPFALQPSTAGDCLNGFASIARFFPEAKGLLGQFEEELWQRLYGLGQAASPLVFDDQYISTGGQIYELLVGHDRFLGDLRPLAYRKLGYATSLVCHPYDICTALLLEEAGGVVEDERGCALRAPLDTVTPVSWFGWGNPVLADRMRPVLHQLIDEML